jgi:hypothetical protein
MIFGVFSVPARSAEQWLGRRSSLRVVKCFAVSRLRGCPAGELIVMFCFMV